MKAKIFLGIFLLFVLAGFVSAQSCTDSDNGNNANIKGITKGVMDGTSDLTTKEDYCHTDFLLIEYYCRGDRDTLDGAQIPCPNGCADGACITETSSVSICTDSDKGLNASVFGEVEFKVGSSSSKKQDECILVNFYDSKGIPSEYGSTDSCSGNDCYVKENFCPESYDKDFYYELSGVELIKCQHGCNSGACLPQEPTGFWSKIVKWFKSLFR
jgi:hypothetical protein